MSYDHGPVPGPAARIQIRPAEPADVNALVDLETQAFASDRLNRRSFAALIKRPSAILLVAADAAQFAGYALVLTRRGSLAARLYSLAVDPALSGRGIGALLLTAAERAAAARGAQVLRLEVRADNPGAIGLYESRGYRCLGRREGYYQDGMDALRFERRLAGAGRNAPPQRAPVRPLSARLAGRAA